MKRYIKNFMMAMMIGATVFGSSCTDSFEEVNTDPDSPTDVPTTNLLAYLYITHPIVCMIGGSRWMSR